MIKRKKRRATEHFNWCFRTILWDSITLFITFVIHSISKLSARRTHYNLDTTITQHYLKTILGCRKMPRRCRKARYHTHSIRNVTVRLVNMQSKQTGDYRITHGDEAQGSSCNAAAGCPKETKLEHQGH